jgi:hypothetical protein
VVLQWAHDHGCPWDEETLHAAKYFGHLEVLRWAREHGCPEGPGLVSDDSEDSDESEESEDSEEELEVMY